MVVKDVGPNSVDSGAPVIPIKENGNTTLQPEGILNSFEQRLKQVKSSIGDLYDKIDDLRID